MSQTVIRTFENVKSEDIGQLVIRLRDPRGQVVEARYPGYAGTLAVRGCVFMGQFYSYARSGLQLQDYTVDDPGLSDDEKIGLYERLLIDPHPFIVEGRARMDVGGLVYTPGGVWNSAVRDLTWGLKAAQDIPRIQRVDEHSPDVRDEMCVLMNVINTSGGRGSKRESKVWVRVPFKYEGRIKDSGLETSNEVQNGVFPKLPDDLIITDITTGVHSAEAFVKRGLEASLFEGPDDEYTVIDVSPVEYAGKDEEIILPLINLKQVSWWIDVESVLRGAGRAEIYMTDEREGRHVVVTRVIEITLVYEDSKYKVTSAFDVTGLVGTSPSEDMQVVARDSEAIYFKGGESITRASLKLTTMDKWYTSDHYTGLPLTDENDESRGRSFIPMYTKNEDDYLEWYRKQTDSRRGAGIEVDDPKLIPEAIEYAEQRLRKLGRTTLSEVVDAVNSKGGAVMHSDGTLHKSSEASVAVNILEASYQRKVGGKTSVGAVLHRRTESKVARNTANLGMTYEYATGKFEKVTKVEFPRRASENNTTTRPISISAQSTLFGNVRFGGFRSPLDGIITSMLERLYWEDGPPLSIAAMVRGLLIIVSRTKDVPQVIISSSAFPSSF